MAFTRFMDMFSGGSKNTPYEYVYIEAEEDIAAEVMEKVFDAWPYNVNCECCGQNFSVSEYKTLGEATEWDRRGTGLEDWLSNPKVKVIYAEELPK